MAEAKEKTVEVIFLRTYTVKDEEGRIYHEGDIVALPEPSAKHFIKRGAARVATAEDKKPSGNKKTGDDEKPSGNKKTGDDE